MIVRCGCGKAYQVDEDQLRGRPRVRVRCRACQEVLEVSMPGPAPSREEAAGPEGVAVLPEGRRVCLAVLSGPDQGTMIPVLQPRLVIGRSDADVILADPEISRRHAVLEVYGDRFIVRDLNSTNGTFVGDRRITAEELESQEEFRVGTSRLMFIVTSPDA
ncbi:MAG: FHA domain-containing protein [Acidobacteriota bacterium]|jgi:predicted Zn finger-like uncharacterized protein